MNEGARTAVATAQYHIDTALNGHGTVLEAGCGSASNVNLARARRVIGVDISAVQLERNRVLHERIRADLQTTRLDVQADVVISWDVLEHLERPVDALDNLAAATRPGGVIVIAVPNVRSLKALVARWTPHAVHHGTLRWLYPRHPEGEDVGPFPTVLDRSISAGHLARWAAQRGMMVREVVFYESAMQAKARAKLRLTGRVWRALDWLIDRVTGGRISASCSEVLVVLAKP